MDGQRVLLVDDEAEFVEVLKLRLESRGIVVETAGTGAEALEKVKEHAFDAIVLDLVMPGMDGIETLQALRELNPDIQVIVLTGHGNVPSGIEAMKSGAMDFLEKPAKLEVLLAKLDEAQSKTEELEEQRIQESIDDILVTKGW
jgi:DNA-binding NtrC family response regulator